MKTKEDVGRKAKQQFGIISRAQALEAGMSSSAIDRRLKSRVWEPVCPRVYRIAGAPDSDHQRILAAVLALGPKAMASHTTAAWLWGLQGLSGKKLPEPIEVSAPRHSGLALKGVRIHHPRDLATAGKSKRNEIPTTHLARTLVDLSSGEAAIRLERAFDSAWRIKTDLPKWVPKYVDEIGASGRAGIHHLLMLAKRRQERPTDTTLEADVLRELRRARLPLPTLQHSIWDAQGFIARVDFAYVAEKVVLFADSWAHHHGRISFDADLEQRERLAAAGWTFVGVTSRLIEGGSWLDALNRHLGPKKRAG